MFVNTISNNDNSNINNYDHAHYNTVRERRGSSIRRLPPRAPGASRGVRRLIMYIRSMIICSTMLLHYSI